MAREDPTVDPARKTPICAIGASAGGVGALQTLFRNLPEDLGLAYVVITHLTPDHPSALREILAGATGMDVTQVESSSRLAPNCVYVIPPDRELVINGDDVTARPFSEPRGRRAPIDMFFRSVAAARGDGLAVILTGAGSDGAIGVRAVKEGGGVVFVQDPSDAEYPIMPRSAIAEGVADFVAPLRRLAERIAEVAQTKRKTRQIEPEEAEPELRRILGALQSRTGHDFASYKRATVLRRVMRRMQVARRYSLAEYADYLLGNPEESQELFDDLLISVTQFFRDADAYEVLAREAIAPICEKPVSEGIRAWVAGCATGEEAYSIAMLMLEEAYRRRLSLPIQIFATDLDEGALGTAREGLYPESIVADVSEERLSRFFMREGTHFRIKKEVRDVVLFARHSVLKDPPFMRLDLVSCRNLLIYLEREQQRQLCTLFHYGLRPNGFLFLGSAETVESVPDTFFPVNRDARLYRAREISRHSLPILSNLPPEHRPHLPDVRPRRPFSERPRERGNRGIGALHAIQLERNAPPSALVDRAGRIQHLSPTAGRYLLPSAGPFSDDIGSLVRPELRGDLRAALHRAVEQGEPSVTLPIAVAFNGVRRRVCIQVKPVAEEDGPPRHALVFFLEGGPVAEPSGAAAEALPSGEEAHRLHEELRASEDRLAISYEEHERSIEDLRVANEELQSINEEYRSTAEELETSKEELQSMNEELQTVNAELKSKLETISTAHNDLQNMVVATEMGTLFLSPDLRIKLFTPAVAKHFNITDSDIGRPISDFTHDLAYDGVEKDAREVLRTLVPSEKEVMTKGDDWLILRMRPYRTVDDRIDGVVVGLADITARKRAEEALAAEMRAMNRLQELSTRVIEASEIEAPLGAILDAAIELIEADFGTMQLRDIDGSLLRIVVHRGFDQPFLDRFGQIATDDPRTCSSVAFSEGRQVVIEDVLAEPRLAPNHDAFRAAGVRGVQSTPLYTSAGKLVGILSTHFRTPRRLSDHHLRLIRICARQAADAINAYQLQQSLRDSEGRLRKVLETEAVGVIFFDDTGTLIDANDAFLKMSGYTRAQVENRELNWRKMTPSEYFEASEGQMALLARTGRIGPYEKEYFRADGERRWMLFAGRQVEPNLIAEYVIEITDRKRAEAERELLARELSHRVKNTLAVVQALARQTGGRTIEEFREAFSGRLSALATAHNLLLETDWISADLEVLVRQSMVAYGAGERIEIEGVPLTITAKQALGLSLVLHELATNALKYGALSDATGRVRLSWRLDGAGSGRSVSLRWEERDGPDVVAPGDRGFGGSLIDRAAQYDLDGTVEMHFAREGLVCELEFPVE
jgi:two-component system CheB/CheR fusion protein